jgi:hypothetical protein
LRETPWSFSYDSAELTQENKKLESKETIAVTMDRLMQTCGHESGKQEAMIVVLSVFPVFLDSRFVVSS